MDARLVGEEQKVQNAQYSIQGVQRTGGNYQVYIENTGEEVFNLDNKSTLYVGVNGNDPVAVSIEGSGSCSWSNPTPGPGETSNCDTGVSWDSSYVTDGQTTSFDLRLAGPNGEVSKATYQCTESSSSNGDTC
jgi:archaellum component FlaG (FlaF/FlaG flagellin family)